MLWHVTDKAGAEEIVKNDFKIEGRGWFSRKKPRFGGGAYFEEHLDLEQASEDEVADIIKDVLEWEVHVKETDRALRERKS